MSMIKIVREIKEIHPEYVALIKCGSFYRIFGKDAYIIANLFKYAIKEENGVVICGFPCTSLNKVIVQLENKKINYIVVDRRDNYDVNERVTFENLNSYEKQYEISKIYVNNIKRINVIHEYLLNNVTNENLKYVLSDMERAIDAERKI